MGLEPTALGTVHTDLDHHLWDLIREQSRHDSYKLNHGSRHNRPNATQTIPLIASDSNFCAPQLGKSISIPRAHAHGCGVMAMIVISPFFGP